MHIPLVEPGTVGPCPVAPDALQGIKRQQTNPARWNGEGWNDFVADLRAVGVEVAESAAMRGIFATDAGGTAYGMPHGVVVAHSAAQVSALLKAAQVHRVPVTVRGGGLTTEGESVAYGGSAAGGGGAGEAEGRGVVPQAGVRAPVGGAPGVALPVEPDRARGVRGGWGLGGGPEGAMRLLFFSSMGGSPWGGGV